MSRVALRDENRRDFRADVDDHRWTKIAASDAVLVNGAVSQDD